MARLLRFLLGLAPEFAPLLLFWVLDLLAGVRIALIATVLFALADMLRRHFQGLGFTRLYLLSSTLVVVFGMVDVVSVHPFLLRFEAVITNAATAIAFAVGSFGRVPMVQEIAERQQGTRFGDRPDIRRFFQLFTLLWAAYFAVKTAAYLWLALAFPFVTAAAIRGVAGPVSLGLMMLLSARGRSLFQLCRRVGLLPPQPA